jgi:hypothetical protein
MGFIRPVGLIAVLGSCAAACASSGGSAADRSAVPIRGCDRVAAASRCDEVVQAAAEGLPAERRSVSGVIVMPPNDRQLAFDGVRPVVANVRFEFADGSSVVVAVVCRSVTDGGPRCIPG